MFPYQARKSRSGTVLRCGFVYYLAESQWFVIKRETGMKYAGGTVISLFDAGGYMIQGIYLASQGMSMLMQKQDQIANNLANVNTTGYKQSSLFAKAYEKYVADDELQPFVNREIKSDRTHIDFREGAVKKTGNPLDMMIRGSGFFTVMAPDGVGYTRNGNFSLDADGFLVTSDGYRAVGRDGYIRVDTESPLPVRVTDRGEVLQGKEERGTLRIVDFKKPYRLLREGNSLFRPQLPDNPAVESPGYTIRQGFLEGSNVNIVKNMVEMISAFRTYEADQRALLAQDETLDKAVNQVGRVQ